MRRRGSFFTFPFSGRRAQGRRDPEVETIGGGSIGDVLAAVQRLDTDAPPTARGGNVRIFTPPLTARSPDRYQEDPTQMHGKHGKQDETHLVSDATEAATVATLTELARRSRADKTLTLPGGERTLEQVVREAISEHLSGWLDANLPALVERIVRDEVRRMTRRAEDD